MKNLLCILSVVLLSASYANADCKTVPVITGEFATEHEAIDANKTKIVYEQVCNKPKAITEEFVVDPTTLEVKKDK
jgi:hypothetical protein